MIKKICFVATVPAVINSFMGAHIKACVNKWSVYIICSGDGAEILSNLDSQFLPLAIERKISLWRDFLGMIQLVILFRSQRFDVVHSIMPKAGLLSMLAGWLAGVPNRIHTFTGQVWANKQGWGRGLLKVFDKLIVLFATQILVDSPSQRDFLVSEGILPRGKGIVIGNGSICGVDQQQFHPDFRLKHTVREELGINSGHTVVLFLGRLNRDKGIFDLATAFSDIALIRDDVILLLVGAEEDVSFAQIQEICALASHQLRRIGFTTNPERYMAAADIFCLPSYREGFGQVIIEAAASGVPAVASRIYGITDAVEDGKTGLLFPARDITALTQALLKLIEDQVLRQEMGEAARMRAVELFSSEKSTEELLHLYEKLMARSS